MAGVIGRLPPLLLALLLAVATPLVGQEPRPAPLLPDDSVVVPDAPLQLRIDAPPSIPAGELLVLDAAGTNATAFRWSLIDDGGNFGPRYRLANNDRTLFFATARPGRYVFVVAASTARDLALQTIVVNVEGAPAPGPGPAPGPAPGPGPGPPAPPAPVIPDGKFGLTRRVYELAKPLADQHGALFREIAGNYSSAASSAAGLASATPQSMRTEVTDRNRQSAGGNREALIGPLFGPLGTAFGELDRSGKLSSKADMIDAFNAVAAGFRLAAGGT